MIRNFFGITKIQDNHSRAYQIKQLLSSGYTQKEVLDELAISRSTLYRDLMQNDTK
jgi:DNA-binding CsgD family transcriptional regulator